MVDASATPAAAAARAADYFEGKAHLGAARALAAAREAAAPDDGVFHYRSMGKGDATLVREWCERRLAGGDLL